MAFNGFAFFAIFFLVLAIVAAGALVWVKFQEGNLQVGDIVRTTFTACPTVLTTALFGVNGEYSTAGTYGYNFEEDAVNALHCDMPKGVGTFSTWVSDGGQNFKNLSWLTNSQLYVLQQTCSDTPDCSNTTLQCGPGYTITGNQRVKGYGGVQSGPRTAWINGAQNPAANQCPGNSFCDLCGGPAPDKNNPDPNYCSGLGTGIKPDAIGICKSINQGSQFTFSCTQPYPNVPSKYCAVALPPASKNVPTLKRLTSCTSLSNYSNTFYSYTDSNNILHQGVCGDTASYIPPGDTPPFFCQFQGNPMCLPGQECVTNWSSLTGWAVPGNPVATLSTTANVCSGTIYPNTAMKTQWIAEGTVTSLSPNKTFANVQWNRVANTYPGIGPSALWCSNTANCSQSATPEVQSDLSWVYSDCRFVKGDSVTSSRHQSVSLALLGTSATNPVGLSPFSVTDASFSDFNLLNLLFVSISSSGTVSNNWSNTAAVPFRRTAWDLQSVGIPSNRLQKVFFYSIHPFQATSETVGWHLTNYS